MRRPTGGIARAASVVAIGILVSRILGFARNVVLANRLGDSPAADAYEAAFIVPDFLNYLLAGGFLAITFIPILSGYRARGDGEGARAAFNAVLGPVAVLIIALTVAAALAADLVVGWLFGSGGRLDAAQLAEVARLTRLVLPAQIFFVLGGLFTAVQYAHGRFLIPTLAPIIYNLGIIVGGVLGTSSGEASATGFIVGAVAGASIGNFAVQWWGAARAGFRVRMTLPDFRHPAFREYLVLAFPLMLGQSIVVLDESIGKIVAASASDGSIFGLNLARRVNMLPVGVIAQAAGVAAFPFLARLVAEGRGAEMRESMGRTVRTVLFASGGAVAAVVAVSLPAVRVAFQHGAFSEDGTVLVAAALVGGGGLGVYLDDFTAETIADPERLRLSGSVTCHADDESTAIFPHQFPGVLRARLKDGSVVEQRVRHNRGGPENPLSAEELGLKFSLNARLSMSEYAASAIHEAVMSIDRIAARDLAASLARPAQR